MAEQDPNNEAKRLREQRRALAAFGGHAISTERLQDLLQEAATLVSQAIEVELVKVLELLPGGDEVLVRAGVNWRPGVVGHVHFAAHEGSPAGYAIQSGEPVISHDVAKEHRFAIPAVLKEHGVRSMINVVICGERGPWGVLEVDSRQSRDFDEDDASFLQNYANLLAAAIERLQIQEELERSLQTREMLLRELQHRVRNLIGNVRALARRIAGKTGSVDEFLVAFDDRLEALGRTQEMLSGGSDAPVRLRAVLQQEMAAHGFAPGDRMKADGPDVVLAPRAAQALALAFHELATNAVKHGALRGEEGLVAITWDGGQELAITWRESGVSIDHAPARRGYGSEVIEKSLPYMLGGTTDLMFHPDGLECTIRFPLPQR